MTRTARSSSLKAILKDRESRTGLDKSLRKNGAGGHNWGTVTSTFDDDDAEDFEFSPEDIEEEDTSTESVASDGLETKKSSVEHRTSEEDIQTAREYRKHAFKGPIDLSAIARTSAAVSTSPTAEKHMHLVANASMSASV